MQPESASRQSVSSTAAADGRDDPNRTIGGRHRKMWTCGLSGGDWLAGKLCVRSAPTALRANILFLYNYYLFGNRERAREAQAIQGTHKPLIMMFCLFAGLKLERGHFCGCWTKWGEAGLDHEFGVRQNKYLISNIFRTHTFVLLIANSKIYKYDWWHISIIYWSHISSAVCLCRILNVISLLRVWFLFLTITICQKQITNLIHKYRTKYDTSTI